MGLGAGAGDAHRQARRGSRLGTGRPGGAAQLNRAGHWVTVFERADRIGGLLRYGIPEFKLEKRFLDRRLDLLTQEGIEFRTGVNVGVDITVAELRENFDAIVLAGGSTRPRDLPVPGRELSGIHFAMEYLTLQNQRNEGDLIDDRFITARNKHVIIIGGGDTGADCLGTAHRPGREACTSSSCSRVRPKGRADRTPGRSGRTSSGSRRRTRRAASASTRCRRRSSAATRRAASRRCGTIDVVVTNGRMEFKPIAGSEFELKADLVLLAMGFLGPETNGMLAELGVKMTDAATSGATGDG